MSEQRKGDFSHVYGTADERRLTQIKGTSHRDTESTEKGEIRFFLCALCVSVANPRLHLRSSALKNGLRVSRPPLRLRARLRVASDARVTNGRCLQRCSSTPSR